MKILNKGAMFSFAALLLSVAVPSTGFGYSGQITNQDPTSYIAGTTRDTYLAVKNTGSACVMAVKVTSYPSGWSIDNGAIPASDFLVCNGGSDIPANGTVYPGPFKATPSAAGGSGTITWELWRVHWYIAWWVWDEQLYTKSYSVSALAKPSAFSLSSPVNDATGVDQHPTFTWGAASAAASYRVEMKEAGTVNDWGSIMQVPLGNVTSWTYNKDSVHTLDLGKTYDWRVYAINAAGETLCNNSGSYVDGWRKFYIRSQVLSGEITNQDPTSFTGGYMSNVYVAAENTGDPCVMAVKIVSYPAGWTVNNGAGSDFIVCNSANLMSSGQTVYPGPFKATPPVTGGSGTFTWELWKGTYVGAYPVGLWTPEQKLDTYSRSVSSLGKPTAFSLSSPANDATGVDPHPTFTWQAASGATSYRVEMKEAGVNEWLTIMQVPLGNVTSWTYDMDAAHTLDFGKTYDWRVYAISAAGETLCNNSGSYADGWRKIFIRSQVLSGEITNQDPTSFTGGYMSDVYVAAQNNGDPCVMAVKITSYPTGWTVNNGGLYGTGLDVSDFIVCNSASPMSSGQTVYPGPFKATPPVTGGSGTFTWELWKGTYVGAYPVGLWTPEQKLDTYSRSVSTAAGVQPFCLLSPSDTALNTGTRPLFAWSEATNSTAYRLVVGTANIILPVAVLDVTITNNWFKPAPGLLQNSTRYYWNVVAQNEFGERYGSATAFTFDTGSATMETRIIGYEQTTDRHVRLEIAADYNAFGFTAKPAAVWVEYHVNDNVWPQRVPVTECTTPAGNFYYAELDNGGSGFALADKIDLSVGMSALPYVGFPLLAPPIGTVYGSQMTTRIHANQVSLDIADAGRGYIGFKPYTVPYSVVESGTDEAQITFTNLTIENNLFCYARVTSFNTKTGEPLRGGAGFANPIEAYLSSPTWPQILANIFFGEPKGPHYIRGKKVDVLKLLSLNTILGEPDIFKHASFRYLSEETLNTDNSILFSIYKGGLGTTVEDLELPLLNLTDTILEFVPFLFSGLEKPSDGETKGMLEAVGKIIFKVLTEKLAADPDVQQKLAEGNPEGAVDLVNKFITEFTKEAVKNELAQKYIEQGFSAILSQEMAKECVQKVTIAQGILNSAVRLTQYACYPPYDYLKLTASSHSVSFDPKQIQFANASPLSVTLGIYSCTNASQAWSSPVGESVEFEVAIHNASSNETVRDVWLGMDIYSPSDVPGSKGALYEYTNKVENTLSPVVDLATGRKGRIKFQVVEIAGVATNLDYTANADNGLTRFLDLPPGVSAKFRSDPYTFDTTPVPGGVYSYSSGKYMTHIAVWANGYPSDTHGIPASIVFNSHSLPIFLTASDMPPTPVSLTTDSSPDGIFVGWDPVARLTTPGESPVNRDVEWVAVYRAATESAVFSSDANVIGIIDAFAAEQFLVDTNVLVGATWYYGAKTIDSGGRKSAPSTIVAGRIPVGELVVSPTNLVALTAGATTFPAGTVTIGNQGHSPLTAELATAQQWLLLASSNAVVAAGASTNIEVYVDCSQLTDGQHVGNIHVTSTGADGSPKDVAVTVTKSTGPVLSVMPQSSFTQIAYGSPTGTVYGSLVLSNVGDLTLGWSALGSVSPSGSQVSLTPDSGSVAPGSQQSVLFSYPVDTSLQGGSYVATMYFSGDQVNGSQTGFHYTSIVGSPEPQTGTVIVNIEPVAAVSAGATWRLDSGAWQPSDSVVAGVSTGQHTIAFSMVSGWIAPGAQIVTVIAGQTNTVSATYSTPPGPSGSPIVFASNRSGNWDIWRMNPDGSGLMQLTTNALSDTGPQWSTDGQQIAFNRGFDKLMVMDADGGNQREVITARGAGNIRWSPDGTFLVYTKLAPSSDWNGPHYRVNLDGTGEALFIPDYGKCASMTFGPDGTNVLWVGATGNNEPTVEMYSAPLITGTIVMANKVQLTTNSVSEGTPKYSPDYTHVLFQKSHAGSGYGEPRNLHLINPDGTSDIQLTFYTFAESAYDGDYSPTGDLIVFTYLHDGTNDIAIIAPDGSGFTNLTQSAYQDIQPHWNKSVSSASNVLAEPFVYPVDSALYGQNGGAGWYGPWYGGMGFTNSSLNMPVVTNYPAPTGNKTMVNPPVGEERAIFRLLDRDYSSGRIYFGYMMNYNWYGPDKYAGLSLFSSNTSEKLFVGEIYGQDQTLGIDNTGSSYILTAGVGNDYLIIGYYDWSEGVAKAKAYQAGTQEVSQDEPVLWDIELSIPSNIVGRVDTIRLAAGASSGTPGNTYFDEIRIATNWNNLIGITVTDPCEIDAPATIWASTTNSTDFTTTWDIAVGASGYYLDVSTNVAFSRGESGYTGGDGLFISQYIETSSGTTPKGIELWNAGSNSIDFSVSGLDILISVNGGVLGSVFVLNSGILAAGDVMVVGTTDLVDYVNANYSGRVLAVVEPFSFNGDDAMQIKLGGIIQDTFGVPANDPGSGWVGNGVQTYNQNISLNIGINTGDTDGWTDPSIRFETTFTNPAWGVGYNGFGDPPDSGVISEPDYVFGYSNRLVGLTTSQCVTGLTSSTVYYYRVRAESSEGCLSVNSMTGSVTTLPTISPGSFEQWIDDHCLSGSIPVLFAQITNGTSVANGFAYAFGENLPLDGIILRIRNVNGHTVVEIPAQDATTLPYVRVGVMGSANMQEWNLPIIPAQDTDGKPNNCEWHQPEGVLPEKAFFKLEAELQ